MNGPTGSLDSRCVPSASWRLETKLEKSNPRCTREAASNGLIVSIVSLVSPGKPCRALEYQCLSWCQYDPDCCLGR